MFKAIWRGAAIFAGLIAVLFVLELTGVGFFKVFAPMKENVRREVFENTKSYTHGKIQELAKYYKEHQEADATGKATIETVIRSQFAEFDEQRIASIKLRNFLTTVRGY